MNRLGWRLCAMAAACVAAPIALRAAQVSEVTQVARAFSVSQVMLHRGDIVRFVNADRFLHQVSVSGPGMHFTSAEQEPGKTIEIPFDAAGLFTVRCEIHPKMLLLVTVQ